MSAFNESLSKIPLSCTSEYTFGCYIIWDTVLIFRCMQLTEKFDQIISLIFTGSCHEFHPCDVREFLCPCCLSHYRRSGNSRNLSHVNEEFMTMLSENYIHVFGDLPNLESNHPSRESMIFRCCMDGTHDKTL